MFYDRKIKYLDYYENGERVKGSGFVKLEVRDGSLRVDVTVAGLHPTDSFERDVLLCAEKHEKAIGKIVISQGQGHYLQVCNDLDNLCGVGLSYGELRGIRILLGTGREISCSWQGKRVADREEQPRNHDKIRIAEKAANDRQIKEDARNFPNGGRDALESVQQISDGRREALDSTQQIPDGGREALESTRQIPDGGREVLESARQIPDGGREVLESARQISGGGREAAESMRQMAYDERENRSLVQQTLDRGSTADISGTGKAVTEGMSNTGSIMETGKFSRREESRTLENMPEKRTVERGEAGGSGKTASKSTIKQPVKLMEDKWSQLWAIYPHVRPFRDGREYLSIGPADFILFSADAYKIVNNSFLLHGYYNYSHLILTRIEKKGEILYYIGTPGNYYEREKQVAIMFGFESFECAEEPAQTGDFGYYMMRTEL